MKSYTVASIGLIMCLCMIGGCKTFDGTVEVSCTFTAKAHATGVADDFAFEDIANATAVATHADG